MHQPRQPVWSQGFCRPELGSALATRSPLAGDRAPSLPSLLPKLRRLQPVPLPGTLLTRSVGMGWSTAGDPCPGVPGCLHCSIAPSISFDVGAAAPVQQPGRAHSGFPLDVTGGHKTQLRWPGSRRQGCLHLPVLSTLLPEGSSIRWPPIPRGQERYDGGGLAQTGGSWSWP